MRHAYDYNTDNGQWYEGIIIKNLKVKMQLFLDSHKIFPTILIYIKTRKLQIIWRT